jgi:hypothetical protein
VDGLKVNLQLFQIAMSQADELDLAALALNEASGWSGTKNGRSVTIVTVIMCLIHEMVLCALISNIKS